MSEFAILVVIVVLAIAAEIWLHLRLRKIENRDKLWRIK